MVKTTMKAKTMSIADFRKLRMKRAALVARAKLPAQFAKEKDVLEGKKKTREIEKEKDTILAEKRKQIETLNEIRDLYPEMSDTDFKRFAKTQFNIQQPVIETVGSEIKKAFQELGEQGQNAPPTKEARRLALAEAKRQRQLEEGEARQRDEEARQQAFTQSSEGKRVVADKEYRNRLSQLRATQRQIEILRKNPTYEKYDTNRALLAGAAGEEKQKERNLFRKIDEEIKLLKNAEKDEDKDVKASKAEIKKLGFKPSQEEANPFQKRTPFDIQQRKLEEERLIRNIVSKPDIILDVDTETDKKRRDLARQEAMLVKAQADGKSQTDLDKIRHDITDLQSQLPPLLAPLAPAPLLPQNPFFAPIIGGPATPKPPSPPPATPKPTTPTPSAPAPAPGSPPPEVVAALGLNRKYAIHPMHIKESGNKYVFNAKAKKHIENLYTILPEGHIKRIITFSILNKARNDRQGLTKHKGKKSIKGYKAHGGGMFSSILESLF